MTMKTLEQLIAFVNQRPGIDPLNYSDWKSYRRESAEVTRDRHDFHELLGFASRRFGTELDAKLTAELQSTTGRLTMDASGQIEYCTGQYFATEYRPAACRVLANLIWAGYRDEKDASGQPVYSDGHAIHKAIKRNLSRRVGRYYFN